MLAGILTAVKVIAAIGTAVLAGFAAWKGFAGGSGKHIHTPLNKSLEYDSDVYSDDELYGRSIGDTDYGTIYSNPYDDEINTLTRKLEEIRRRKEERRRQQREAKTVQSIASETTDLVRQRAEIDRKLAAIRQAVERIIAERRAEEARRQQQQMMAQQQIQASYAQQNQYVAPAPVAPVAPAAPVAPQQGTVTRMVNIDLSWDATERKAIQEAGLAPQPRQNLYAPSIPNMATYNPPTCPDYMLVINQQLPPLHMRRQPSLMCGALNTHNTYHPAMRRNQFYASQNNSYWHDTSPVYAQQQQLYAIGMVPQTATVGPFAGHTASASAPQNVIEADYTTTVEPVTSLKTGVVEEPVVYHIGNK